MKELDVDWRFCPECGCIQNLRTVGSAKPGDPWEPCEHDFRPNSPRGVLGNQEKELGWMGRESKEYAVKCYQSPIEIETLLHLCRCHVRPKIIIEIGTFHGGVTKVLKDWFNAAKIICVDRSFEYWLAGELDNVHQVQGESVECAPVVEKMLAGAKVDFLFIDGDHSLRGAMDDYLYYEKFVRSGGMIAFHDVKAIPAVRSVWEKIEAPIKFEISSYQGIGVIVKE